MRNSLNKLFVIIFIIVFVCLLTACNSPNIDKDAVIKVSFSNVGYEKSYKWNYAQGLTTDGTYFYFAGHNDKTNENADIHIIDRLTMQEVCVLSKAGPLHSAELCYCPSTDTLLACSGGDGRLPFVYEINKSTGELIDNWDFAGVGENGGALIALSNDRQIILLTSSDDGAKLSFAIVDLMPNGQYNIVDQYNYSDSDLGVPQGLEYRNGYVYYLADAGINVNFNPHYLYKLKLTDGTINIVEVYKLRILYETEGICFDIDKQTLYFSTCQEKIYKIETTIN